PTFVLARAAGGTFGIAHTPFTLGGGDADDLIVAGWPPSAIVLHVAQGELFVQATESIGLGGVPIEIDELVPVAPGDTLAWRGETFASPAGARVATPGVGTTAPSALPRRAAMELLPRGGRAAVPAPGPPPDVSPPARRFDLIVALLRPPAGYAAGDAIPD